MLALLCEMLIERSAEEVKKRNWEDRGCNCICVDPNEAAMLWLNPLLMLEITSVMAGRSGNRRWDAYNAGRREKADERIASGPSLSRLGLLCKQERLPPHRLISRDSSRKPAETCETVLSLPERMCV